MPLSSSIATRLEYQHRTIREIIGGLPDGALRREVNPGKWSAHSNIAHLAAYQPAFLNRLDRIGREHSPAFDRYVAENDPLFRGYLERSTASLLEQVEADRTAILTLFTQVDDSFLERTGAHPRFGLLTVVDWTEFFLLHEAHHLYTLYALVHSPQ
jgi:uncharacterized damage-inducible protein DinB